MTDSAAWFTRFAAASPDEQRVMRAEREEQEGFRVIEQARGLEAALEWQQRFRETSSAQDVKPVRVVRPEAEHDPGEVEPIDLDSLHDS